MIKFNPQRRTLEREDYRYELQEVQEPNLYRDIFTYEMPPMMCFNHRVVPMIPPEVTTLSPGLSSDRICSQERMM